MGSGEISRGEKMLSSGTDPESYITEYTSVHEDEFSLLCSAEAAREKGGVK